MDGGARHGRQTRGAFRVRVPRGQQLDAQHSQRGARSGVKVIDRRELFRQAAAVAAATAIVRQDALAQ